MKIGDPVTLMWCGGVRRGRVEDLSLTGAARLNMGIFVYGPAHASRPSRRSMQDATDEGITWLPGAVTAPEALRALLAAAALNGYTPNRVNTSGL